MDFQKRIMTTELMSEDMEIETTLRPKSLSEYIGQDKA